MADKQPAAPEKRLTLQDLPDEAPKDIRPVRKGELAQILIHEPVGTCVQVVDDGFQFLVIATDMYNNPYWLAFDGKDMRTAKKLNAWFIQGQKLFTDHKPLSQEDVSLLHSVLVASATLCNFLEYDEKIMTTMTDNVLVKFAHHIYQEDFPDDKRTMTELCNNDEFMARINMVTIYAHQFAKLMEDVRNAASVAANDMRSPAPAENPEKKG